MPAGRRRRLQRLALARRRACCAEPGCRKCILPHHGHHARTFPARWPLLRLDRIYVRGVTACRPLPLPRRPWALLSDHAPLAAEIDLPSSRERALGAGNRITLLENGEGYYPRVFDAIAAAAHEVLLETFILFDDPVGRELQRRCCAQRARRRGARAGRRLGLARPAAVVPAPAARRRRASCAASSRLSACLAARINMLRRMHRKLVVVDGGAPSSAASTTRSTTSPSSDRSPSRTMR
jgi:hypothetical protein